MPEINIRVQIIGGKRTDLCVYVESMAINRKTITLSNGFTISDEEIVSVIDDAIIQFIER